MTPANQNRASLIAASQVGARLFRMFVGFAWTGNDRKEIKTAGTYNLPAGSLVIFDPRPVKIGVPGMSDSCGLTPVVITPDMVGQTVAVYCAVEDKQGQGRLTPDQLAFLQMVRACGGRAGVSRSPADTVAIVTGAAQPPLR